MTKRIDKIADFPRGPRLWLAYLIYQIALHLLLPLGVFMVFNRSRKEPLYRANLRQRFGFGPQMPKGTIWVFAASLGETRAVSPLIGEFLKHGHKILLTHSSPAGLSEGKRLFSKEISAGQIVQSYVPVDAFWAVRLFLSRARAAMILVVEGELWPAMLFEAHRAKTPIFQVNGNYTDQALTRDKAHFGGVRLAVFQGFTRIITKSDNHVARYRAAGYPADRIDQIGELKFDQAIDPAHILAADDFRASQIPPQKTLFIASSVEGEEEDLTKVVQAVLKQVPDALIIWAPRSPQRFDAVADKMQQAGFQTARRSKILNQSLVGELPNGTQVLIGDSIGEMNFYYQLADLVFVGASLIDHGGHNIIEPLALGKPVVMGPSIYGIEFPAYDAIKAGAFESLPNSTALAKRIVEFFNDPDALAKITTQASTYNHRHIGAAKRSYGILEKYLAPQP